MTIVAIEINPELTVEQRLRLKTQVADAFRRVMGGVESVGVDLVVLGDVKQNGFDRGLGIR